MRIYVHRLVVLFILVGNFSAYPADKSPKDCKLENCEEWDAYLEDCVPIDPGPKPGNCWKLNDICQWVEIDPGPKPGDCWELNDICQWVEIDPGPKPGDCWELNDICQWVEIDPGENLGRCWEFDEIGRAHV